MILSYQQQKNYTCGCAALRTILAACGKKVPGEKTLERELRANNQRGTSPGALKEYLRKTGLTFTSFDCMDVANLRKYLRLGWVALLDWVDWGGHWVVAVKYERVKGWSGGRFVLADPAAKHEGRPEGITYVSGDRLKSMWWDPLPPSTKGYGILIKP